MANAKLQTSFNSGEISPELFSRPDLQLHKFGAAKMRNWVAKPSGAAQLRPGFEYVESLEGKTRAIPFKVDGDDLVIAMRAGEFRFFQNGLPVSLSGGVNDVFEIGDQQDPNALDLGNNEFFTKRKHDFSDFENVVPESTGTLPGGIASAFDYQVRPQGPRGLQLKLVSPAIDPVPITSRNTGTMYLWRKEKLPAAYDLPHALVNPVLAADRQPDRVRLANPHQFKVGDRFKWITTGGGVAPVMQPFFTSGPAAYNDELFEVTATTFAAAPNYAGTSTASTANDLECKLVIPNTNVVSWSRGPYYEGSIPALSVTPFTNLPFTSPVLAAKLHPKGTVLYLRSNLGDFSANDYIVATKDVYQSPSGPLTADGWALRSSGSPWLTLSNSYAEADLFQVTFAQTENKIRFAHKDYPTIELNRGDDGVWTVSDVFTAAPSFVATVTANRGAQLGVASTNTTGNLIVTDIVSGLGAGDLVYIQNVGGLLDDFYVVGNVNSRNIQELVDLAGNPVAPGSSLSSSGTIIVTDSTSDANQRYLVSAVDAAGSEFALSSATASVFNLLQNAEAFNTISWDAQPNAVNYRIYKEIDGVELFGFIAETGTTSFKDRNISADLGRLAPEIDTTLAETPPASVAFYDQRGVFGGTQKSPQLLILSSLGRTGDLVTRNNPLDEDRISLEIASREGQSIRHIVPLSELLVFTDTCEWALTTRNTDTLTPTSATMRMQATVGSNFVRPQVLNNTVLFCSKGNHVHRFNFQAGQNSFGGLDLSTKAGHLFDDFDLVDSAAQTSRLPVAWFVNSDGKLLGLTYSQEEQVSGWHQHELADGAKVVSVAVATEGSEDRLYATVQNKTGGYELHLWGLVNLRSVMDSVHLDNAVREVQTDNPSLQITITGNAQPGAEVHVSAATPAFDSNTAGEELFVPGLGFRARIKTRSSKTELVCLVVDPGTFTAAGPATATVWGITKSTARVSHLTGTVDALLERADGTFKETTVSVVNGIAALPEPCRAFHLGNKYDNELRTMPAALQIEAAGVGRLKSVDRVDVQLFETAGLSVGPDAETQSDLTPGDFTLQSKIDTESVESTWSSDGQVSFVQNKALPATVAGVTLHVNLGG